MRIADRKLLVACSMKSGSAYYVAKVLSLYFDLPIANPFDFWGEREQNLYPWHFENMLAGPFVLQLHIKPHPPHLQLFQQHGIEVVYQWRNLGDVIISFDDHIVNEDWKNPVCYLDNVADYAMQPKDARHKYLIRHALPWYISFDLMWRRLVDPIWQVLCKYEHMCSDPGNFFARIISSFNFPVKMDRLHAVISNCTGKIRFNIGIPGRSIRELSEENKALLEQMLIEHPQDLSELLYELPWWPSRRGQSPDAQRYDNALIRSYGTDPESEKLYLIKDGKRRWITSPQWSKDAGRKWSEVQFVSREQLESIPLGPSLCA